MRTPTHEKITYEKTVFLIIFSFLLLSGCAPITRTALKARNIFYVGGDNGVKTALVKAGYRFVDDFDKAEVFVLNGEVVNPSILNSELRYGKGSVLIPGKNMENYGSDMDVEALIGQPVADLMFSDRPVRLEIDEFFGKDDPLITEIDWKNAPEIRERAFFKQTRTG